MSKDSNDPSSEWLKEASDSLLSGAVSATHLQRLVSKAEQAGARGAHKIAMAGKSGSLKKNICRDMVRFVRKSSHWPNFYYAQIPVWDCKNECRTLQSHPFLLPHEWLAKANGIVDFSQVRANAVDHVDIFAHMQQVAKGLNSPMDHIPLGLHCDGVPFGSQVFYSDSLELFSLNFPCGPVGKRLPFTSVQKNHLVKHETYNAILGVLAWSLKHLALGILPETRHDGSPFGPGEHFRKVLANHHKPAKALLVEIRADWVALKQVFQFPQQNENSGICWMCMAKPSDIRDCSGAASWRTQRRTAMSFHAELMQGGKHCPLWSVPGVSSDIVVVDWLHCADLGVTADILGNILLELVDLQLGSDRSVKMKTLWHQINDEYGKHGVSQDNRFPVLRLGSFFNGKKSPKLKGKAAHIRALVPILDCIVQRDMTSSDIHTGTVKSCMKNLATCYACLKDFSATRLDAAARRMAVLYCSLEKEQVDAGISKRWRVKPKLHLFQELCHHLCLERQRGNPRNFWTYADESHGGIMRQVAKSRGGKNSSAASAYRLLSLWSSSVDLFALCS